jgi:uncharacterized membrane protein YcaP (DUF421 family)
MENALADIYAFMNQALGLDQDPAEVLFWQLIFRAMLMYVVALALVRAGKSRLFGKNAAFDVILGVILGSVLSRGINGVAPFFGTMALGIALIGLHWLLGYFAYRHSLFGKIVKGQPVELARDGQLLLDNMRQHDISDKDLLAALRMRGQTQALTEVKAATLEPSGDISIVLKEKVPQVVEVEVQEGVQKIWISFR